MNNENCLICGKPIRYMKESHDMVCSICGKTYPSYAECADGHFVCDDCHREKGMEVVRRICVESSSKDPIAIIKEIMEQPEIHMHGPEHHVMVGASLLTAYHNAGGNIDFKSCFDEIQARGEQVPGGICGFWGCCGAAVSSGIFFSVITSATPLRDEEWGMANRASANALLKIAKYGGPRCCKRDSFLSILSASQIVKEELGIELEIDKVECSFSMNNHECIEERCPFFHGKGEK